MTLKEFGKMTLREFSDSRRFVPDIALHDGDGAFDDLEGPGYLYDAPGGEVFAAQRADGAYETYVSHGAYERGTLAEVEAYLFADFPRWIAICGG